MRWAMSQENVEVVQRAFAYELYGRGDRAEAEAIFDPHVVMNPVEEGPSYGLDAIRDNFEHWKDAWDTLEVTVEELIDAGDRVLLTAHHLGRGRASGVEVDTRLYSVYTLRDGKVVRARTSTRRVSRPSKLPGFRSRRCRRRTWKR
jgi:ketosteroid isomerase-like protein